MPMIICSMKRMLARVAGRRSVQEEPSCDICVSFVAGRFGFIILKDFF
jgi:hypothetical protein